MVSVQGCSERRDAVDGIICHICGKVHIMALTPFPDGEEWPCPYDSSKEAFHVRVAIVVRDDPTILGDNPNLGSEA